jgi:hypothetical protein
LAKNSSSLSVNPEKIGTFAKVCANLFKEAAMIDILPDDFGWAERHMAQNRPTMQKGREGALVLSPSVG